VRFPGAGVYGLYYVGNGRTYAPLAARRVTPIYVGQSARPNSPAHPALCDRMQKKHARSIAASGDLKLSDFMCRALVLVPEWIEFAEHQLIDYFRPLWNKAIPGLGSNPTGGPRSAQQMSKWDVLHGGRAGAGTGAPRWTKAELRKLIREYLAAFPPRTRRP
jgi:hypothetical protein